MQQEIFLKIFYRICDLSGFNLMMLNNIDILCELLRIVNFLLLFYHLYALILIHIEQLQSLNNFFDVFEYKKHHNRRT